MKKDRKVKIEKAVDKLLGKQYNPGSLEAEQRGCTCPILDNGHGNGYMGQPGVFVYNGDCPMHGFNGTQIHRNMWRKNA